MRKLLLPLLLLPLLLLPLFTSCENISKQNAATIEAKNAEYKAANADQIKKDSIETAEAWAKSESAKKAMLAKAKKKMRIDHDDMRGVTFYTDKTTPDYANVSNLSLYIATGQQSSPTLRFKVSYKGEDWLFLESLLIKTDKGTHQIPLEYGEVKRDNSSGEIWEWYDVVADGDIYTIAQDIATSKNVKLRYNGQQYYKDRTITAKEKQALKNVFATYEALGGSRPS